MKKILFLFMLIFNSTLWAQEVVSTAGETQIVSDYEISWTIGEPVINTFSSGSNILTQGFHQSKLIITAVPEISDSRFDIQVYPNPTHEFVIVQFNEFINNSGYRLFDFSGKILESKNLISTETRIDLKNFSSGSYLLQIQQNGENLLRTFKIIKK